MRGAGVVVCLAGTIEPADDVVKMHASALDTFASPNGGSLGRVEAGDGSRSTGDAPGRRHVRTARAAERVHLITATVAMDGSLLDAAVAAGADGIVVAATGAGNTDPALLAAAVRAIEAGHPGRAAPAAVRRVGPARPTRSRAAARRGSGPARSRSATCARSRPGSRSRSGSAPASTATGWPHSSPTREA